MITNVTKQLKKLTKTPEIYLSVQNEKADKIKKIVKNLYDYGKQVTISDQTERSSALPELVIENTDEEQIWQQLELNNEELIQDCLTSTSNLLSFDPKKLKIRLGGKNEEGDSSGDEDSASDRSEEDQGSGFSDEEQETAKKKPKKKGKSSIVDDQFFKLSEMKEFLEQEDRREARKQKGDPEESDDEEIDLFQESDDDDSEAEHEKNLKYGDFFDQSDDEDQPEASGSEEDSGNDSRRVKFDLSRNDEREISDQEFEQEEDPKSSFEHRQENLKKTIERLEEKALREKPWQLKGEVDATARPENSLLEEVLDFDSTTRPAPIITEQTTMKLEDIIRQRIKDQAFDDVERKVRPTKTPQEYRKDVVLNQEKSKESLAQIYEKEYLKEVAKLDPDADEKPEEEPKQHQEIRKSMNSLFVKLDALSNFHYTPKPAAPEVKIITNTPAIMMEEVTPVAASDATLLAPEEVKRRPKGDVMAKEEKTKTDKRRERRLKKKHQRVKAKREAEKETTIGVRGQRKEEMQKLLKKVVKNKNVEKMKMNDGIKVKSSKAFFSQLQEKVQTTTKASKKKRKRQNEDDRPMLAKKFKL